MFLIFWKHIKLLSFKFEYFQFSKNTWNYFRLNLNIFDFLKTHKVIVIIMLSIRFEYNWDLMKYSKKFKKFEAYKMFIKDFFKANLL